MHSRRGYASSGQRLIHSRKHQSHLSFSGHFFQWLGELKISCLVERIPNSDGQATASIVGQRLEENNHPIANNFRDKHDIEISGPLLENNSQFTRICL